MERHCSDVISFALVPRPLAFDRMVVIIFVLIAGNTHSKACCYITKRSNLGKVCVIGGYAISGVDVEIACLSQHTLALF